MVYIYFVLVNIWGLMSIFFFFLHYKLKRRNKSICVRVCVCARTCACKRVSRMAAVLQNLTRDKGVFLFGYLNYFFFHHQCTHCYSRPQFYFIFHFFLNLLSLNFFFFYSKNNFEEIFQTSLLFQFSLPFWTQESSWKPLSL